MKRVAIVGLGFMGKMHYDIYSERKDVEVYAIAEQDEKKRKGDWSSIAGNIEGNKAAAADIKRIKMVPDYRELLGDKNIDWVDICIPTFMHKKAASDFLKAGYNVLVEKPLCPTVKDAKDLLSLKNKSKGIFMVAQCIRFWPGWALAAEAVRKKTYGKVIHASFKRVSPPVMGWNKWFRDPKKSGGAIMDLHIHDVDFIRWVFGRPKKIMACGRKEMAGITHIYATYLYKNFNVCAEGGWDLAPTYPFNMYFCIVCEKATLEYDFSKTPIFTVYMNDGQKIVPKIKTTTGWHEEIDYFISLIKGGGKQTFVKDQEIIDTLDIIFKEKRSMSTGKPVTF
ncbi:MAG: Gfo/Idh/MocA family oxidoreductase [Candidatus Omnitrophica bacterium]|nr:Gfo/Idh/MocA family oxidoreductase [Candidatus Omnitrophota bacterium]